MFTCLGGADYWPLSGGVGLFRSPLARVVATFVAHGRGSPWVTQRFDSLDQALILNGPYRFLAEQARFAIQAKQGEWTVVLDSSFPVSDIVGFLSARARRDIHCEFIGFEWIPKASASLAGAAFVHVVPRQSTLFGLRRSESADERRVQVSDQDGRWEFNAIGNPRSFEDLNAYARRRIASRIDLDMLYRYLSACGIPVDERSWLTGPVVVATRQPFGRRPEVWSSMEELRGLCGYPRVEVPTDLVRFDSDAG